MSKAQSELRSLLDAVVPHRDAVEQHPLYVELTSLERIHAFMEHHVFAVWDFMCLLKALQRRLTCPTVPWLPVGDPQTRRLINEIVLSEESDELPDGRVLSHFELYLAAMSESGADFSAAAAFEHRLKQGRPVRVALREVGVPAAGQEFVLETLDVVEQDQPYLIAAVFTVGREQMIPGMFVKIVRALADAHPGRLETFKLCLERHIELDRSEHGPLTARPNPGPLAPSDQPPPPCEHAATNDGEIEVFLMPWRASEANMSRRRGTTRRARGVGRTPRCRKSEPVMLRAESNAVPKGSGAPRRRQPSVPAKRPR